MLRQPTVPLSLGAAALLAVACGQGIASPTPNADGPVALPAGIYQSQAFQPALTFTLPAGWWIAADTTDYLGIEPVDTNQAGIFLFRDPLAASQDASCPLEPEPGIGSLSSDLSAWMRGLPGLAASTPRLVTIGGLRGTEIDLRIARGWAESCPFANGLPTTPLFVDEAGELRWVVAGSEELRVALLDVPGGGTVVVDIDAFDGALMADLLDRALPIVNSFRFATQ